MKKYITLICLPFLFIAACAPAITQTIQATETLTPVPTVTQTPIPPTFTITALPTIPTFTPTFDVSTIVTVTPAEKAECPIADITPQIDFEILPARKKYIIHPNINKILNFLNSGGEIDKLDAELKQTESQYLIVDITNDNIPDLVVVSGTAYQSLNILWCQDKKYTLFPKDLVEGDDLGSNSVEFKIHDLNNNGILEILSIGNNRGYLKINIHEWNGKTFVNLIDSASNLSAVKDDLKLIDFDKNGISEIVIKELPNWWYYPGEPIRTQIDTYFWNGTSFTPSIAFSNPQYQFQAIQDADIASSKGEYEKAISLYNEAIFNHDLLFWSKEIYDSELLKASIGDSSKDVPLDVLVDPSEYPRLAAYAFYRIMLIRITENQISDAANFHQLIKDTFGSNKYAAPYAEMTSKFWEAYQSTHKMYDGCAAAIQYAVEHPEILTPLGGDYHGAQSHIYVPADVCPFR